MRKLGPAVVLLLSTPALADVTFGLGLRADAESLRATSGDAEDQQDGLVGGGLHFRVRFGERWGLELSAEALHGERAAGAFQHDAYPVTLSGVYHFVTGTWDGYVLLGIGGTEDDVKLIDANAMTVEQKFHETHVTLGIGVERMFGHFGLGAELRAIALQRKDHDTALPGDAIPATSAGAMFNVAATYYF